MPELTVKVVVSHIHTTDRWLASVTEPVICSGIADTKDAALNQIRLRLIQDGYSWDDIEFVEI